MSRGETASGSELLTPHNNLRRAALYSTVFFFLAYKVLGGFTDGLIKLDDNSGPVLKDALSILSCKVSLLVILGSVLTQAH